MQYGLIGKKLGHSYSKTIHNMLGTDYELLELTEDEVSPFLQKKDFKAINVTIPYKQTVISCLDYTDSNALEIGAVNTIVNKDGKLCGYNTDFAGMRALFKKEGIDPKGKKVAILGSGGTSKTANAVCRALGAKQILTVSRKGEGELISYDTLYNKHTDIQIIVNTTPCGMFPNNDTVAVDIDRFPCLSGVIDAVYNPLRTPLVQKALSKGIKATGGLYMLVSQAVFASEHFTGKKYTESITDSIYNTLLKEKENIVLIGMAGCGKSTYGRLIANQKGIELIDTDRIIENKAGMKIPEIFAKYGEEKFRELESEAVYEASKKSSVIIATGGGAVLKKENVFALKQNGKLVFLDRPVQNIPATSDRPLSNEREKLERLHKERLPIYTACADIHIKTDEDINTTLRRILDECYNK